MDIGNKKTASAQPKNGPSKPGNQNAEKPKGSVVLKSMSSLRMIFHYMWNYKGLLFAGIFALLMTSLCTLAIFRSLEWIVDGGFGAQSPEAIKPYFLAIFGVIAVLAVSTFFRFLLIALLGERVVADIRRAVHKHLLTMPPSFFEANRPSEIASRLTADTTLIQAVVSGVIPMSLSSLLQAVGALVMIVLISPTLIFAMLGLLVLIMLPVMYFGKKVRVLSRASQDRVASVGTLANEAYSAIQVVQAFTREEEENERFSRTVRNVYLVAKKRIMTRASLVLITTVLVYVSLNLGLWTGAAAVFSGSITGGELVTLLGLGGLAATSIASLGEVITVLQRAAGAAGRLSELLAIRSSLPVKEKPAELADTFDQAIAFDNVSFAYPSKPGIHALKQFSMAVLPGETVAIVGASGAGKSTVLQLLLRFFDPQEGTVTFAENDIRNLSLQDLRAKFAFVPQEAALFANTIEANVLFGRPTASTEELIAALDAANCTDFIKALPDGIKTYLGERGVRLSGGQRQRLAIARAILRNAPVLLLDEATSSLDSESEDAVQKAIEALMENRTTIVIAHRLSTVRKADKIMVLDEGSIVATGKHNELVAQGGLYARLAKLQFTDIELKEAV